MTSIVLFVFLPSSFTFRLFLFLFSSFIFHISSFLSSPFNMSAVGHIFLIYALSGTSGSVPWARTAQAARTVARFVGHLATGRWTSVGYD
jgi:hypothetical protein